MGAEISIYSPEDQANIINNKYKPFADLLINSIIHDASYSDIKKYNLKRLCCSRDSNDIASVTVPIANLNIDYDNLKLQYGKDINIDDFLKTYTSIKITPNFKLNDEICTIDNKTYIPSTENTSGSICDSFYQTFCSKVYDNNVAIYGNTVNASYVLPPPNASQDVKKLYNNANWASDCNCYNSVLAKKPSSLSGIQSCIGNDCTPIQRDNLCGQQSKSSQSILIMPPYWTNNDWIQSKVTQINCSNVINVIDNKTGKDLSMSGLNLNNNCGSYSIPSNQISSNQIPSTQIPSNQIPSTQIPSNQIPSNQISSNQIPSNQIPSTQIPSTQIPSNQISSNQIPSNQIPSNQIPSTQIPLNQIPSSQIPSTQIPSTQIPSNSVPNNNSSIYISESFLTKYKYYIIVFVVVLLLIILIIIFSSKK